MTKLQLKDCSSTSFTIPNMNPIALTVTGTDFDQTFKHDRAQVQFDKLGQNSSVFNSGKTDVQI